MGRWAYGAEIPCGSGRCRNLAEWLIMGTRDGRQLTRNQPVCGLHRGPATKLFRERNRYLFLGAPPEVVPLQDPRVPVPAKLKPKPVRSPRGPCPGCGKDVALRSDGYPVTVHQRPDRTRCPGWVLD